MAPTGVLLMAYGTPGAPEELEEYYTDIRRGARPTPELLADLRRRYDAIGGVSPLAERTREQAAALQTCLDRRAQHRYLVALGTKHGRPSIDEAVGTLSGRVREVIGLVLAPHYSALSTGDYEDRARRAAEQAGGIPVRTVRSWHLERGLVQLLAERIREAIARLPTPARATVVMTAHSLPKRIIETGDPYADQLRETAAAVAAAAGVKRWTTAWQSAGRTPEPWLGPDLLELLPDLAGGGDEAVVVCPAGFTSDHLEVLYDIDIEAHSRAASLGMRLERTASLNDDPRFIATLATVVERAHEEGDGGA